MAKVRNERRRELVAADEPTPQETKIVEQLFGDDLDIKTLVDTCASAVDVDTRGTPFYPSRQNLFADFKKWAGTNRVAADEIEILLLGSASDDDFRCLLHTVERMADFVHATNPESACISRLIKDRRAVLFIVMGSKVSEHYAVAEAVRALKRAGQRLRSVVKTAMNDAPPAHVINRMSQTADGEC